MGSVLRVVMLVVAVLAALCAVAAAGPRLEVSGELPCSPDELAAALAVRVDGDEVVVVHGEGDRVSVRIGPRVSELDIAGARGPEAARLIALAAAELAMPAVAAPAPVPAAETAPETKTAAATETAAVTEPGSVAEAVAVSEPVRVGPIVVATARVGSEALVRGGIGAGVELGGGRWRAALDAGLVVGGDSGEQALTLIGAPLRAGVAGGREITLRLTGLAIPYSVRGGVGDTGVLFGAGMDGRGVVRVGSIDVALVFGVDVMVNQVTYQWGNEVIAQTPRVALWSGVGVVWGRP